MTTTSRGPGPQSLVKLPYGDLAVALYASDLQTPAGSLPEAAVAAYAEEGARRLGGYERVAYLHRQWRGLNQRFMNSRISPAEYRAALADLWPDARRLDACMGYDIGRLLPQ